MNYTWELNDFDTTILGFKTAKITSIESPEVVSPLITDLSDNKIEYATFRVEANNFKIIHALESAGFLLVDGLLGLQLILSEEITDMHHPEVIEATMDHLDELKLLAGNVFEDTRFYNDPIIPIKKANKIYEVWIENSLNKTAADKTFIWYENNTVLGFITIQLKGHIPLVGVSKSARGKGIAKKMVQAAINEFKKHNLTSVEIETQMANIPAIRAYQANGFKMMQSYLTYRWSVNSSII